MSASRAIITGIAVKLLGPHNRIGLSIDQVGRGSDFAARSAGITFHEVAHANSLPAVPEDASGWLRVTLAAKR